MAMPVDDELTAISKTINEGIENMRTISGEKSQSALSWHNLFRAVDADGASSRSLDACPSTQMMAPSRSLALVRAWLAPCVLLAHVTRLHAHRLRRDHL